MAASVATASISIAARFDDLGEQTVKNIAEPPGWNTRALRMRCVGPHSSALASPAR